MNKCNSETGRHTWVFTKNIMQTTRYKNGTIHFSKRGDYKCECGERKIGNSQ